MMKQKLKSLFPAYFVIFLDMLGYGLVIPVLTDFLFDTKAGFLLPGQPEDTYAILYGFVAGIYPLMQFFGAPFLGALSDKYGRKKILIISLLGTFIGYLISGYGLYTKNIELILIGRAIDGFTGGNISIAFSAVADLSEKETKAKNFGYAGAAFGVGLILGPFLGGLASDSNLVSWFTLHTPFWIASALTLFGVLYLAFGFKETLKEKIMTRVNLLTSLKHVARAFQIKKLRFIFFVSFLLSLGFTIFVNFFPLLLEERFGFTRQQKGNMFAYAGIWTAVGLGLINNILIRKYSSRRILFFSILFLAITFALLIPSYHLIPIYIAVAFVSIFHGINQPNSASIVSNLAEEDEQGEILGINQSLQSLAQSIPTILAGYALYKYKNPEVPIILAALSTLLAWVVFLLYYSLNRKK